MSVKRLEIVTEDVHVFFIHVSISEVGSNVYRSMTFVRFTHRCPLTDTFDTMYGGSFFIYDALMLFLIPTRKT